MTFVTGGTGLLGTHLILKLHAAGHPVKALYRSHIPAVVKDKATWIQGDILDVVLLEEVMKGVEYVYHVAGLVSFNPADRPMLFKINVEGTANVVNACIDAGVKKLIHVSSVAALGRIRPGVSIDETMKWTPETSNSIYGKTKYLAEMEVWRGISEGLPAAMVNPVIIIGEHGDWTKGSMNIFRNIKNGFPWYSTGSTGFVDADDVAAAMIALMHSDVSGQKFILSADNVSYQDFFYKVADAFGVKRPHKKVTPLLAALVWRFEKIKSIFTGKQPLITKETAHTGMATTSFNNKKLLQFLPQFSYTSIDASVKRICAALAGS
ncbi:MAG: NAD-dependent epimerase/dehydratase family protein [Chitinophagaceae bacterium]|jgi:nucleoside-diphosphate-sugar epimerase|nr:NAD-dependent epimerase/dehydratase family protein [Chitinophagaceae bacterium]